MVLHGSLTMGTLSGASLFLLQGWACSYHHDIWPQVFTALEGLWTVGLLGLSLSASDFQRTLLQFLINYVS